MTPLPLSSNPPSSTTVVSGSAECRPLPQTPQWRCAARPPGSPALGSSHAPSPSPVSALKGSSKTPFGVAVGGANVTNMRLMPGVYSGFSGASSSTGARTPTGGATPHGARTPTGGATPHGGTPRRGPPQSSEPRSPSRPLSVQMISSAAWRLASPRHAGESPPVLPGSVESRPKSVPSGQRGLNGAMSRRFDSPQLSLGRFDSPQASPAVFERSCGSTSSAQDGEAQASAAKARLARPALTLSGNAGQAIGSTTPAFPSPGGLASNFPSSPASAPVQAHERVCRSPASAGGRGRTPCRLDASPGSPSGSITMQVSPRGAHWASGPLPLASGTMLGSVGSPKAGAAPGSPASAPGSANLPVHINRYPGSPHRAASSLQSPSSPTADKDVVSSTPLPEEVPPWRSSKQIEASALLSPGSSPVAADQKGGAGLSLDIGWTPSFHSLAVASPHTLGNAPAISINKQSIPEAAESAVQQAEDQAAAAEKSPEKTAHAMVMDIEDAAARAISAECHQQAQGGSPTAGSSRRVRWDGNKWVESADEVQGDSLSLSGDKETERTLEDLKSSINAEMLERQRMEALHDRVSERLMDCERRVAELLGDLEETKGQRDDLRRQLKEKSDKHLELVRKFRRYQEGNQNLEEDLALAGETCKQLEAQADAEQLAKSESEHMVKELQLKLRDFEQDMVAVTAVQAEPSAEVPQEIEDQLEKLRRQLEETVKAVQLRCGTSRVSGDLCQVSEDGSRGPGVAPLSASRLMLLEEGANTKPQPGISAGWVGADESTALSTEEELPTAEEQLIGEWSSTSLQARCPAQSEGIEFGFSEAAAVQRMHGVSSADSLAGASIASASGAAPSEIDGGDVTESLMSTSIVACQAGESQIVASGVGMRASQIITLSLRDLSEIKALKKPPPPIRMLMEVCCLLFHIQPVKQADERNAKKHKLDYWEPARRYLLSDPFFLSKLRMYEADDVSHVQRVKIKKYFQDPEFAADRVRNCSKAAHELYEWVWQLVQPDVEIPAALGCQSPPRRGSSGPMSARRRESPSMRSPSAGVGAPAASPPPVQAREASLPTRATL